MRATCIFLFFCLATFLHAAEEVNVRHILVETIDEADFIRNEIVENGGDRKAFMAAARKYSKDVTTERAGGELGWNTRQKFVREFSDAAFNLNKGEVSVPVKSQYGWHVIYLEDRRDRRPFSSTTQPQQEQPQPTPAKKETKSAIQKHPDVSSKKSVMPTPAPRPGPSDIAPGKKVEIAPKVTSTKDTTPPVIEVEKKEEERPVPQKPRLPEKGIRLLIDIENKVLRPTQTVQVGVRLVNHGQEDLQIFSPDLLPLGFNVLGEVAPMSPPATWDALKSVKPEPAVVTLRSLRSLGGTFTLNDYFKDLPPNGRYSMTWKPQNFFQNLQSAFPEISKLPEMEKVKETFNDPKVFTREVEDLEGQQKFRNYDRRVVFSIFDPISPSGGKKYYASLELDRQARPIYIELFTDEQLSGVRHFARLAQSGFYDWLSLFDVQKGNYIRGGSPTNDDFGGPDRYISARNSRKISHEKGTISMVARPSGGGTQIGSIFFICRKPHPEWDSEHVPIGKIIQGEEILESVESTSSRPLIRKINILTADRLPGNLAEIAQEEIKKGTAGRELPVAKIKTEKGEITIELYEDDALQTVSNFVELAEGGFFNPKPEENKEAMTFYAVVPGIAVITGSPTNDDLGNPGHRIPDETVRNTKKHEKGTLTMLLETDPASNNPVPDTAGSQFMICLQPMPAWDSLYTPFGKVTQGLDVLEKIQEGDKIESVTIASKRNHVYRAQKLPLR